ncbi:MAG TPA: hypothetical protein VF855_06520, partial [Acidimicrobiales bacterium]
MSIEAEEDQWFEVSINQMLDVMARNKRTLDDADDGETFSFQQWFNLILIGPGHDNGLIQICNDYGVTGTVTKEKGSSWNVSDKGSLTFTGAHDPNAVEEHVRALPSKKECVFQ